MVDLASTSKYLTDKLQNTLKAKKRKPCIENGDKY